MIKNNVLIKESDFEKIILKKIENLGWEYKDFDEVFELRNGSVLEVLLIDEIKSFLVNSQKLNDKQINKVIRKLRDLQGSSLEEANQLFTKYFIEGIKINDEKNNKFLTVKLYDNRKNMNRMIVTNQFVMRSSHPNYKKQIPDIVLYLNGLPVVIIELKRPSNNEQLIEKAHQQIENYKRYLSKLFIYNVFNIISDGDISKVGSLTSSLVRYSNWRGKDFSSDLSNIFDDLLIPKTLIELASQFTFYASKNNFSKNKIIAGYHQYYGVKSLSKTIIKAMDSDKKGGIFWHTQGSGKSYSMIFLTKLISQARPGTTFLIITDRNDLDNQLYNNFNLAKDYVGQKIKKINKIKELKSELMHRKQDGIFFSTIQKFTPDVGVLINRDNVVVISDEAHRSHNNIQGRYEVDFDNNKYLRKFGSAKYLRDAFPNATFAGFTGTPIEKDDKSTTDIFGKFASIFTMQNAEKDGIIVEINYESRKPAIHFDEEKLKILDQADYELNKNLLLKSNLPGEMKKKINKAVKSIKNFISDSDRIKGICEDLIQHYSKRKKLVLGKAMIVTLNRHVAFKYYKTLIKLDPNLKKNIKLIFSGSTVNNQNDPPEMIKLAGTKQDRKKWASEFKNENSEFKIAIVVEMWLVGFDVQSLDTLYLDKPLKMHNLMQTIARTNRVYSNNKKNIVKESGLIVDYIGIWKKLGEALSFYSNTKKKQTQSFHDINIYKKEALKMLDLIYHNYKIKELNIDFQKSINDGEYAFNVIEKIADKILSQKKEKHFVNASSTIAQIFKKTISVLSEQERIKFYLLLSSRRRLIKLAMDNVDFVLIKKSMIKKLDDSLDFAKTVIVDKYNNKPININDIVNYYNIINAETKTNDLKEKERSIIIKVMLKELSKIDIVTSSKLSHDLRELLTKYDNSHITLEELRKGLIVIHKEADNASKESKNDEMTNEERNFYKVLIEPIKQSSYDKVKIKIILKDLLVIINNDQLVNKQWFFNPQLKRKTRAKLKILLKKHKYPPEKSDVTKKRLIEAIMYSKELSRS